MKRTLVLGLLMTCLAVLGAPAALAVSADLKSVEIDMVVRPDGKADVYESLDWTATGGVMHGFYFEGAAVRPVFNMKQCYADLGGGRRVGLDIRDLGNRRFDVVLAGGQGFTGSAIYFLNYGGDLSGPGLMGWTRSASYGDLFYLDWAPEQWDEPLQHRTVRIVLPIKVEGEKVDADVLSGLGFRTERYMNQENSIDAYGTKGADGWYLTVRFHQEPVQARQTQRLQFYLDRAKVPMQAGVLSESTSAGQGAGSAGGGAGAPGVTAPPGAGLWPYPGIPVAVIVFAVMAAIVLLLYVLKTRGYGKTLEKVEGIRWAGDNWIPPKLYGGTYQVKGKIVTDLHPIEVALLLEMPLQRVVAIMLEGLKRQGIIEVVSEDPLQI
ncbi:MAG TPA: hypothetical protein VMV03_15635, partial [Spirochaetia bacterium]|nr:hypothetical protein [Spirochaetia bacterium]